MDDSESATTTIDDDAYAASRRHFDSTILYRRQEHLKTVRCENSRLEESVRLQWEQVRALRREHERIESEHQYHAEMLRECCEAIKAVLRTLEDHLGGAPTLLLKDSPTVTEQPFEDGEGVTRDDDNDDGSEGEELCNLVLATQDYVSEMRKIDQLLMTSSSLSSS
jgi:hypothetical protein